MSADSFGGFFHKCGGCGSPISPTACQVAQTQLRQPQLPKIVRLDPSGYAGSVKLIRSAAIAILAISLAACGGGGSADSDGAGGTLLYTTLEGSLRTMDVASGDDAPFLEPPVEGGRLFYPAVSPGSERIAYVAQGPLSGAAGATDGGMDIWVAAADGSEAVMVFRHTSQNQQVLYPQWQGDGAILAIIQEQGAGGITFQLQRIDLATGERVRLADDIFGFAASRDGQRLALVVLTSSGLEMHIAGPDAEDAVPFLTPKDGVSPYGYPQFSPDGSRIAFASSEIPAVRDAVQYVALGPVADGTPKDIYLTDISVAEPRRVAELAEDDPALTWDVDGTKLFTQGAKGLMEVNLENGAMRRIADGVFHGQVAFLR